MFRPTTILTCLWPGLTRLWWRGEVTGLLPAVAFGAFLDIMLLATLVWPELAPRYALGWGWLGIGVFWGVGVWQSLSYLPSLSSDRNPQSHQLFLQAQDEYLKAHWFEAELLLERVLKIDPRDVEARLLLATMLRHTRRLSEAHAELRRLELLERADAWRLEIEAERRALDRLEAAEAQPVAEHDAGEADSDAEAMALRAA